MISETITHSRTVKVSPEHIKPKTEMLHSPDQPRGQNQTSVTGHNEGIPSDCLVLYLETNPATADLLMTSNTDTATLPATAGLGFGGIYFACSEREAQKKALNNGAMLRCVVSVGRQKEMTKVEMINTKPTSHSLRNDGYDSIRIGDPITGVEHVVYNRDQIMKIERL